MPCNKCGQPVSQKVMEFSRTKFGQILCMSCQKNVELQDAVRQTLPKQVAFTYKNSQNDQRQQGIEETARLRRELDWKLAALNGAISLVESGKRTPDQLYETWKAICEFPKFEKEIEKGTKIKVEKVQASPLF